MFAINDEDDWWQNLTEIDFVEARKKTDKALWKYSIESLMVTLAHELPHFDAHWLDWDGTHLVSKRTPSDGNVMVSVWGAERFNRVALKDLVYLLVGDGGAFEDNCGSKQVYQICGSLQCVAPAHLTLADPADVRSRKECQRTANKSCQHNPNCLVGADKGPAPPPTSSKRQAKLSGRALVEEAAKEAGTSNSASASSDGESASSKALKELGKGLGIATKSAALLFKLDRRERTDESTQDDDEVTKPSATGIDQDDDEEDETSETEKNSGSDDDDEEEVKEPPPKRMLRSSRKAD